ncbi:MAG: hypothetical protein ACYC6J_08310 [Coriobacteriia bacterium]
MLSGPTLIHEVGKRILKRYLEQQGAAAVALSATPRSDPMGIDIRRTEAGRPVAAKVKVDVYCGTDPERIAERELTFYRDDTGSYAFEAIADTATRASGWILTSMADELLYYRVAVARPEAEVAALLESPDGVFFSELGVERDDLRVLPMRELRVWFERSNDRYMPRPVVTGGRSAWYRIVPMSEVEAAVPGIRVVGAVYARLR